MIVICNLLHCMIVINSLTFNKFNNISEYIKNYELIHFILYIFATRFQKKRV